MKRYILLNKADGIVEGAVESISDSDFTFGSLEDICDYVYDNGLNPIEYYILEIGSVKEFKLEIKER